MSGVAALLIRPCGADPTGRQRKRERAIVGLKLDRSFGKRWQNRQQRRFRECAGEHAAEERSNPAHLFDIRGKQQAGPGTVLAICDGGSRGRSYGKSVAALGTLDSVANAVVQDELLNDIAAKDAIVLAKEAAGDAYLIKFLVGSKPGIIKLAIAQDRLFYIKVKANKLVKKPLSFFDDASALRSDMEQLADSFVVRQIRPTCLKASNRGAVPAEGVCI